MVERVPDPAGPRSAAASVADGDLDLRHPIVVREHGHRDAP
jgi:hypothetical protein